MCNFAIAKSMIALLAAVSLKIAAGRALTLLRGGKIAARCIDVDLIALERRVDEQRDAIRKHLQKALAGRELETLRRTAFDHVGAQNAGPHAS